MFTQCIGRQRVCITIQLVAGVIVSSDCLFAALLIQHWCAMLMVLVYNFEVRVVGNMAGKKIPFGVRPFCCCMVTSESMME